jgi:cytidylate kinase
MGGLGRGRMVRRVGLAVGKVGEPVVICVCGMAGSGKSTLARRLARMYGLRYCSGGDALKALAVDEGYRNVERGWWESAEGMRFLERRGADPEFDRAIDRRLLRSAAEGSVVLDSWTMPWLFDGGFKIWLEASFVRRAERVAGRDGVAVGEASEALRRKEGRTREIYRRLYGFSLGEDFGPFDLVLDTDLLDAGEVFSVLCAVMDNCVLRT